MRVDSFAVSNELNFLTAKSLDIYKKLLNDEKLFYLLKHVDFEKTLNLISVFIEEDDARFWLESHINAFYDSLLWKKAQKGKLDDSILFVICFQLNPLLLNMLVFPIQKEVNYDIAQVLSDMVTLFKHIKNKEKYAFFRTVYLLLVKKFFNILDDVRPLFSVDLPKELLNTNIEINRHNYFRKFDFFTEQYSISNFKYNDFKLSFERVKFYIELFNLYTDTRFNPFIPTKLLLLFPDLFKQNKSLANFCLYFLVIRTDIVFKKYPMFASIEKELNLLIKYIDSFTSKLDTIRLESFVSIYANDKKFFLLFLFSQNLNADEQDIFIFQNTLYIRYENIDNLQVMTYSEDALKTFFKYFYSLTFPLTELNEFLHSALLEITQKQDNLLFEFLIMSHILATNKIKLLVKQFTPEFFQFFQKKINNLKDIYSENKEFVTFCNNILGYLVEQYLMVL